MKIYLLKVECYFDEEEHYENDEDIQSSAKRNKKTIKEIRK